MIIWGAFYNRTCSPSSSDPYRAAAGSGLAGKTRNVNCLGRRISHWVEVDCFLFTCSQSLFIKELHFSASYPQVLQQPLGWDHGAPSSGKKMLRAEARGLLPGLLLLSQWLMEGQGEETCLLGPVDLPQRTCVLGEAQTQVSELGNRSVCLRSPVASRLICH